MSKHIGDFHGLVGGLSDASGSAVNRCGVDPGGKSSGLDLLARERRNCRPRC
jgi:hypothetical protein